MPPTAVTAPVPLPDLANGTSNGLKTTGQPTTPAPESSSQVPAWVHPDLTRLLRVEHLPGSFASRSLSLVSLPAGAVFARIASPSPSTCAYTSVQASRDMHIELNNDLVFINHSCEPTLVFDMQRWEVRVNPDLTDGLSVGQELSFFYPSTEWHMSQPFECLCKTPSCRGWIRGARDMDRGVLATYWLNEHIEEMLREKDAAGSVA